MEPLSNSPGSGGVPSVQEVTEQLLSGVPAAPEAAPPGDPETSFQPPTGSGFRVEQQAPSAPAASSADPGVQQRLAQLEQELQRERERVTANQANFHRADSARQTAEAVVSALNQMRQQEAALYQQAAAAQPPQFEDPDALLSDGKQLIGAMQRMAQWNEARLLAQLGPYAQTIAQMHSSMQAQTGLARRMARNEARQMATDQFGVTSRDFDEAWPEIERALTSQGPAGEQMLLDPDSLSKAYMLVAVSKGKNPLQRPASSPTPPSADPRPSVRGEQPRLDPNLGPMARHVARHLGLGNDLPINGADDLARVGLLSR